MAKHDDSQRRADAPPRVYKSSDVHKRRVDRKGRAKKGSEAPPAGLATSRSERDDAALDASPDVPSKSAVVISPTFGNNAGARREADDRWFAAMRENAEKAGTSNGDSAVSTAPQNQGGNAAAEFSAEAATPTEPAPAAAPAQAATPEASATPETSKSAALPASDEDSADASAKEKRAERFPSTRSPQQRSSAEGEVKPDSEGKADKGGESLKHRISAYLPRSRALRVTLIVVAVLLVVALVLAGLFAWNRWYRYDDRADMQGVWYVVGTTVPVSITDSSIQLTEDVMYQYEVNDHDKTIRYTFGPMEGQGRYWFSDDRQYLVITDGDEFDGTSTALDDVRHMFSDLGDKISGSALKLPEGEGIIALSREPDAEALARQQAEAAEKAAAEEAERKAAEEEAARIAEEEAAEAAAWEAYYYGEDESG